jgi:hypothetical protein
MKIENDKLEDINVAIQDLMRQFDQYQITKEEYRIRHERLIEQKTQIISQILDEDKIL